MAISFSSETVLQRGVKHGLPSFKEVAAQLIQDSPHIPTEAQTALDNIKSNTFLLNFIASNSSMVLRPRRTVRRKFLEWKPRRERGQEDWTETLEEGDHSSYFAFGRRCP